MIPIHELLSRIRWDAEYGNADFTIGYYDRIEDDIIFISLKRLEFEKHKSFSFWLYDQSAMYHSVPLHRIRQVYRNGDLIWERQGP